ncbi:MAG: PAS domain S-box protein [Rhodospirillales bacterium]|nr:PAS domain S-box protein [Rhodospirillales bacterium]
MLAVACRSSTEISHLRTSEISTVDAAELTCQALDHSGNIVVVASVLTDARLGLVFEHVNNAFTIALGYAAAEVLGQPFDLLVAPQASEDALDAIRQSVDRGHSLQIELLCRHRGGQSRWLGLHFMALKDSPLVAPCYVIQARDITEKLRERKEQRSVQQLLASVFLFVDVPVAIVNESGAVRMANPPLADLLAVPPGAVEGRPWTDFIDARERDRDAEVRKRHAAGERQGRFAVHLLRPDGAILPATAVSAVVDRPGLERFRIITFHERPGGIRQGCAQAHRRRSAESPGEDSALLAAKITLTGLDEVRSGLGVRWVEQADQAFSAAEEVLRRHLAADESFMRTDDQGFLLRLRDENEEAASYRTAVIARDIRSALIEAGSDAIGASVTAVTAELPRDPRPAGNPIALMDTLDRRLAAQRGRIERHAERVLREAMEQATAVLEPVTGADRGKAAPLAYVALPEAVHRQITTARVALPPSRLEGFDLDAFLLTLAAERIAENVLAGPPRVYLVPVGFETLANRRRGRRLLDVCRALDQPVQQRLALMLGGIPPLVPQARITDAIQTVAPYCRFVGLEIERPELPDFDFAHGAIPVVALPASAIPEGAAGPGRELSRLVALLGMFRVHLLVRRVVPGAGVTAEIRQCGVDLFSWA